MADEQPSAELPKESDSLTDKIDRFFSNDESSVSFEPPSNSSYVSHNIFSDEQRKWLLKVCGGIVRCGVISQKATKELLEKDDFGKDILRQFTIKQIINRLKYERRLIWNK